MYGLAIALLLRHLWLKIVYCFYLGFQLCPAHVAKELVLEGFLKL